MRRREVLAGTAGVLAPAAIGRVRGIEPYAPLGRVGIEGAKEAVVGADGTTAYVAATDGFAVVDVTLPESPAVVAERRGLLEDHEDGPLPAIWDVAVEGDRLLVPGPSTYGDPKGVLLYDVSNPAEPRRIAFHETGFPVHNACLRDGIAYLTAGGPIAMVDVSGNDPREVGRWSPVDADGRWAEVPAGLRAPHDVRVRDGVAYVACWDAGTWLVDVADPAAPAHLAAVGGRSPADLAEVPSDAVTREVLGPPGNHHYAEASPDGSLLAVGKESWAVEGEGGPSGIELWDVSEPREPAKLSEIPPPPTPEPGRDGTWTTAHNLELADDRLVSSWYQGGVKIHDLADPAAPEGIAWWRRPEEAAFWTARLAAGSFVASSSAIPGGSLAEALYTFPNRAGEQADPPPLTSTPDPTATTDVGSSHDSTDTRTDSPQPTPTATRTPSETPDRSTTTPEPADTIDTPGQPGFGPAAAVAALGGAWRWLRDRSGE